MTTLAQELARRINALSYDTLPAAAVQAAKVGILDFVGVTLAGCREDTTRIPAGVLMRGASGGSSLVFGDSARVNALDAALVNGIASHALDFDDCNNTIGGHPSAPILPALIALADETGASGRDLIAAYVAGFETECKLGLGVHLYHYTHGWHPTATLGVFGAAAACAKLMKLPDGQDRHRAGDRRLARLRHQGQLRDDGEAAARRALQPQRPLRGAPRARRLHGEPGRVRAQAGLLQRVQRRRQLRRREDTARVGGSRSTS